MTPLYLALKSLWYRRVTSLLTVLSMALSVLLFLSVERAMRAAEDGFTQSVSQVDLLVGARTGPLNLILYTVFNIGSATNNISWDSYQELKARPEVAWTIPYSLGDGHRGFRVVATDENFYQHYRYRKDQGIEWQAGKAPEGLWDVALGSEVARRLGYKIGDSVVLAHGITRGEGILHHDDKPFKVVGIMKATGTAIDQSLYITLLGMEAIHIDWQNAAPNSTQMVAPENIRAEDLKVRQITAFFLRTKSRIETLRLQRDINTFAKEPLLAIIPGATLSELWRALGQIENLLTLISMMVLFVGFAAMLSTLLATLNERRFEMNILRWIGASTRSLAAWMMLESGLMTLVGILIGVTAYSVGFFFLAGWLEINFGFSLRGNWITLRSLGILSVILVLGSLLGGLLSLRTSNDRRA